MYAVAFDLVVADTENNHPKGVTQAYTEIAAVLGEHGWENTAFVACKEVFTLATMKTWPTCSCYPVAAWPAVVSKVGARHSRFPNRAMVGLYRCRQELSVF